MEKLYQECLIKVVFATETLAAGINMPARTTVIGSLSKYAGDGHRILTSSEFLQMSGRAGRRGMDTVGHVVTLFHPKSRTVFLQAGQSPTPIRWRAISGPPTAWRSTCCSAIRPKSVAIWRQRSFGQFLVEKGQKRQDIGTAKKQIEELSGHICPDRIGDLVLYRKWSDCYRTLLHQSRFGASSPKRPNAA